MESPKAQSSGNILYLLILGGFALVVLTVLLAPGFAGAFFASKAIDAQESSCDMIESFAGQLGQENSQVQPATAEQCKAAVESTKLFTYAVWIFIAYIASIVFGVPALGAVILITSSLKKRQS